MKYFLLSFFLLINFCLAAQNCSTSMLFKKGAELEYKTYAPKGGKNNYFEITRLMLKVEDVKDSNNTKYSFIKKTGTNPNDESLTYVKRYVISCDGNKISLPADLYAVDTVFFSNMHPTVKDDKGIYSSTVFKGDFVYHFPVNFASQNFEATGKKISMDMKLRDYEMAFMQQYGKEGFSTPTPGNTGRIVTRDFSLDIEIKKFETKGKEKITTDAGNFECYRILLTTDSELMGRGMSTVATLYYSPETGFIKSETSQAKNKTGYAELVRVSGN